MRSKELEQLSAIYSNLDRLKKASIKAYFRAGKNKSCSIFLLDNEQIELVEEQPFMNFKDYTNGICVAKFTPFSMEMEIEFEVNAKLDELLEKQDMDKLREWTKIYEPERLNNDFEFLDNGLDLDLVRKIDNSLANKLINKERKLEFIYAKQQTNTKINQTIRRLKQGINIPA